MSNISAIPWQEEVKFPLDDVICFVLDQHAELDLLCFG
jgi:hypothetical protein